MFLLFKLKTHQDVKYIIGVVGFAGFDQST